MEDYVAQQYFRQPGSYSVNGHVYEVDEKGNIKEWTPQGYKTPSEESVSKNLVNVGGRWIPANQVKIKRFSPLPDTSTKKPPTQPEQPQEEEKKEPEKVVNVTKSISPYATKEEQLKQAQEVIKEGLEQEREIIWLTGSYGIMPEYITETTEKRSDATWKRKEIKQGKKTTGEIYLVPGSGLTSKPSNVSEAERFEIMPNKSLFFSTFPVHERKTLFGTPIVEHKTISKVPIKEEVPNIIQYTRKKETGPWRGEFTTTEELKRRGEYYTERPFVPIEGPVGGVASGFIGTFIPSFEVPLYEKGKRVGTIRVGKSEELMTGQEKEYYKIGKGLGFATNLALLAGKPIEPKHYELVGAETEYLGAAAKTTKGTKAEIGAWTKLKYAEYEWGEPTGFIKHELVPSHAELTTKQLSKKLTKTTGEVSFKPPGSEEIIKSDVAGYSLKTQYGAPTIKITENEIKIGPEFGRLYFDVSEQAQTAKELSKGVRNAYAGFSFNPLETPKGQFTFNFGKIGKLSKEGDIIKEVPSISAGVVRNVELPEKLGFKITEGKKSSKSLFEAIGELYKESEASKLEKASSTLSKISKTSKSSRASTAVKSKSSEILGTTSRLDTSLITQEIVKYAPVEYEEVVGVFPAIPAGTFRTTTKTAQIPKTEFKRKVKYESSIRNKGVSSVKPVFGNIFKEETKKKTIIGPIQTELFKQKERKKIVQMPTTKSLFKQEVKQKKATSLLSKLLEKTGEKTSGRTAAKPPTPTPFGFGGFGFGFNIPRIKIPSSGGGFSLSKRKTKIKSKTTKKSYAPDLFSVIVGRKKKGKPKKGIFSGFELRPIYFGGGSVGKKKKSKIKKKKTKK